MPSHKKLQAVANNFVESFLGLTNYWDDDYIFGHLIRAAWVTGGTNLRVDLLSGNVDPSTLLVPPVIKSIEAYVKDFPDLIKRSGSDIGFVQSAIFEVVIEPKERRLHRGIGIQESPFMGSIKIIADNGKVYSHAKSDWEYPEG
jgi:hypothetical protein